MYISESEKLTIKHTVNRLECYVNGSHLKPVEKYGMHVCEHCLSNTDIPIEN